MLKFHVDLGMWDIIHLLYLFRSYFFICTLNPESLKFYLSISSFMQRYPVFSQVYAVLSKASRLSKDLKFYPRMEVSSKDMKIYLGILIFLQGLNFIQRLRLYPRISTVIQGLNFHRRISGKCIIQFDIWSARLGAFQFWESDHLKKYIFHVITVCFSSRQRMRTLLIAFSLQSNTKFYPVGVIGNALELCTIFLVTQPFVLIHLNCRNKGRERGTGLIEIDCRFPRKYLHPKFILKW